MTSSPYVRPACRKTPSSSSPSRLQSAPHRGDSKEPVARCGARHSAPPDHTRARPPVAEALVSRRDRAHRPRARRRRAAYLDLPAALLRSRLDAFREEHPARTLTVVRWRARADRGHGLPPQRVPVLRRRPHGHGNARARAYGGPGDARELAWRRTRSANGGGVRAARETRRRPGWARA